VIVTSVPPLDAGTRNVAACSFEWRTRASRTGPDDLVFATASGRPISPNNVLRRWIRPASQAAGLLRVMWLTSYSSWAHDKGVAPKVVAALMEHAKVDTTLNVYTQVLDGAARAAADRVGSELFRIVQKPETEEPRIH
jgi:integrase